MSAPYKHRVASKGEHEMAADEPEVAPDPEADRQRLGRMIGGFHVTQLIGSAARLGLADRLREGPRSSEEVAVSIGAHEPSMHRFLRALVEIGVLCEEKGGRFGLTGMGRLLQSDMPGSLRPVAMVYGGPFYQAWGSLLESVMTGETAFERVFGAPLFGYLALHPDLGVAFDRTMASLSATMAAQIAAAYDFSGMKRVVDVGGGHGELLGAVLKANAGLSGVLFDQPAVISGARRWLEAEGLSGRCAVVSGDFFDSVPEGGDAYLLKWIIHDWDDERAITILRNCRRAMAEHARLLVMEVVLPDKIVPAPLGTGNDMHMMVVTGGRERTASEYDALFAATGFRLSRIVPTGTHPVFGSITSIVEGVPRTG
jgi:hypothetical protein